MDENNDVYTDSMIDMLWQGTSESALQSTRYSAALQNIVDENDIQLVPNTAWEQVATKLGPYLTNAGTMTGGSNDDGSALYRTFTPDEAMNPTQFQSGASLSCTLGLQPAAGQRSASGQQSTSVHSAAGQPTRSAPAHQSTAPYHHMEPSVRRSAGVVQRASASGSQLADYGLASSGLSDHSDTVPAQQGQQIAVPASLASAPAQQLVQEPDQQVNVSVPQPAAPAPLTLDLPDLPLDFLGDKDSHYEYKNDAEKYNSDAPNLRKSVHSWISEGATKSKIQQVLLLYPSGSVLVVDRYDFISIPKSPGIPPVLQFPPLPFDKVFCLTSSNGCPGWERSINFLRLYTRSGTLRNPLFIPKPVLNYLVRRDFWVGSVTTIGAQGVLEPIVVVSEPGEVKDIRKMGTKEEPPYALICYMMCVQFEGIKQLLHMAIGLVYDHLDLLGGRKALIDALHQDTLETVTPRLYHPNRMAMSFSGELLHLFMVRLALGGRFDIRLHYHGFVPHRASASGTQFFIPEHTVPDCLTIANYAVRQLVAFGTSSNIALEFTLNNFFTISQTNISRWRAFRRDFPIDAGRLDNLWRSAGRLPENSIRFTQWKALKTLEVPFEVEPTLLATTKDALYVPKIPTSAW